jgi:N6-L-threonylcarbamoyladenine synthase
VLVSGGHTALIRIDAPARRGCCGATRDDAAGEAFDKDGKMLGLGYRAASRSTSWRRPAIRGRVALPRALAGRDDLDFSFSGLKTAVATLLARRELPRDQVLNDFCASFQAAVVDVLVRKVAARDERKRGCPRWSYVAASPRTAGCARRWRRRPPRTVSRCTSRRPSTAPTTPR